MPNRLVIMRGLPGSGKSTVAARLREAAVAVGNRCEIFSTDEYFMRDGKYHFNPQLLGQAHDWNKRRAQAAISLGVEVVIIDNTNIQKQHYADYINYARSFGYETREEVVGAFDQESVKLCSQRNVHGVPLEAISRMAARFEK